MLSEGNPCQDSQFRTQLNSVKFRTQLILQPALSRYENSSELKSDINSYGLHKIYSNKILLLILCQKEGFKKRVLIRIFKKQGIVIPWDQVAQLTSDSIMACCSTCFISCTQLLFLPSSCSKKRKRGNVNPKIQKC